MKRLLTSFAAAAVVLLSGCSHTAPVGPRIDPALEGFIPADTTLMAGFRLERIEKTDVYKKYLANRTLPQIQEFAARTGIDPQKNLWELLYLSNGKRSVLLGHGMFSDEGEPDLAKHGDSRFSYGGFNLVGNDQSAILLVNQTVMAVGDTGELKAMVDAHEKPPGPPPAMTALLARMPESAQIWAADAGGTDLHLPIDASGLLANVTKILEHVQSGTIYFDLTSGLNGLAESTSPSAQEAEQLASGLRALIGFGRLSVPANQPELQSVFDGLRPTREDREVKLHVEEPPELVDKLIGMLEGKAAGQPSGLVPR